MYDDVVRCVKCGMSIARGSISPMGIVKYMQCSSLSSCPSLSSSESLTRADCPRLLTTRALSPTRTDALFAQGSPSHPADCFVTINKCIDFYTAGQAATAHSTVAYQCRD
ncbi:hypothetical protein RRG08_052117 [Elysia crispata]|uniref:Uncharacterized protein n=1 Tax=Elysia crispata TaxID=231223 RepID=A0AAE1A4L1_9GAST|nr:hypothetical protein RRG08_052117 [Elysia crispata]